MDDDDDLQPPSLMDALVRKALDVGSQHMRDKVQQATGRLAPISVVLSGIVSDAPSPGNLEILVGLPGARPCKMIVPYAGGVVSDQQHERAQMLVGRQVRVKVEIAR